MPQKAPALLLAWACLACASKGPAHPHVSTSAAKHALPSGQAKSAVPMVGSTRVASEGASDVESESGEASLEEPEPLEAERNGQWILEESRPLRLEALSPSGAWVAYCVGSDLYIALSPSVGSGSLPRKADRVLSWSDDGLKLVILDGLKTVLIDLAERREVDLSPWNPDLESDALEEHRSFAFSSSGNTLAFLSAKPSPELHWLDLAHSGTQPPHKQVTLPYVPWRVRLEESLVELDGGENGSRWPVPRVSRPPLRCEVPAGHYPAYPDLSDPLARYRRPVLLVDLKRRPEPELAPGFVMAVGPKWVRREPSGRLLVVDGRIQKQLASERCGGRIRYTDAKTGLFIVSCEHFVPEPEPAQDAKKQNGKAKPEYRFQTYLLAPGYVRQLAVSLPRVGFDLAPQPGESGLRFVPLSDGALSYVVDLKARTALPLDPAAKFLTSSDERALVLKQRRVTDLGGTSHGGAEPNHELDPLGPMLIRGSYVYAEGTLYHPKHLPRPTPRGILEVTVLGATVSAKGPSGSSPVPGPLLVEQAQP